MDYPGIQWRQIEGTGKMKYRVLDEDGDHVGGWTTEAAEARHTLATLRDYSRSAAVAVAQGNCPWCGNPGTGLDPLVSLDLVPAPSGMHSTCAERYVEAGATFPPER